MTDALTEDEERAAPPADLDDRPLPPPPEGAAAGAGAPPGPGRGPIARARDHVAGMPTGDLVQAVATVVVVASCVAFTFTQLSPGDVLSRSTPTGGDMGAHVWGPAYLRDHLLPSLRLSGWTPDWYAGFPAYQFYMIPPALAIALLSYVLPYGVAFKLVAISGILTLPVAAWACGRLTRLPFPVPPLMAVAATMFLFDRSYSILGGNIASTMAGEFSFSIALSLCVVYLGVVGRGLGDGRHRAWAAGLLGLIALTHPIVFIWAATGTVVWFLVTLSWWRVGLRLAAALVAVAAAVAAGLAATDLASEFAIGWVRYLVLWALVALALLTVAALVRAFPRGPVVYLVTVVPVAGALSAFWTLPFLARSGYMNDMGWDKALRYGDLLFTRERTALAGLGSQGIDAPAMRWIVALAAVGVLMAVVAAFFDRNRTALFWVGSAVAMAFLFVVVPQGRVWNARLLPFYYLSLYVLGAIGVGYVARVASQLFAADPERPRRTIGVVTAVAGLVVGLTVLALPLRAMPNSVFGVELASVEGSSYKWAFLPATTDRSFVPSWARWNFEGYEGKAAYPEYHDVVTTMGALGEGRGCGTAMWEHESEHNRFGTPMALMLLPFWTDGCIGSLEGLYFEAAATTPYHFMIQDELSTAPSNPQRDLPYGPGAPSQPEFERGIDHLQLLGVRYYMAISDRMIDFARQEPDLTEVAQADPWVIFEVAGSEKVAPLDHEPAVLTGLPSDGRGWLGPSMDWYVDDDERSVLLAAGGPEGWQRVAEGQQPAERDLPPVTVGDIEVGTDSISFDVDQVGVPVLVKASYFPNWQVSGAEGPWRVTPNLMVVVPTEEHVELTYGRTPVDLAGTALSLAGVAGLVVLALVGPVAMPPRPGPRPLAARRPGDEGDGGGPGPGDRGGRGDLDPARFDPAEAILGPVEGVAPPEGDPPGRPGPDG